MLTRHRAVVFGLTFDGKHVREYGQLLSCFLVHDRKTNCGELVRLKVCVASVIATTDGFD